MFIYYIDGKKYTTNNEEEVNWGDNISSPDENTPAFENTNTGYKIWCKIDWIWHRLTGPAFIISSTDINDFCLNGLYYKNINDWLKQHPNQDNTFQVEMLLKWS
jgi:hypothetical protein